MQIKVYVIDVKVPRWARRLAVYGGVPAAVLLGLSALVWADVTLPHTFTAGETLTAANLNASFEALRDAINRVDVLFSKGSNNGSVTCDYWCETANAAGPSGTCVGAHNTENGEYYSCSSVLNPVPAPPAGLLCYCSRYSF